MPRDTARRGATQALLARSAPARTEQEVNTSTPSLTTTDSTSAALGSTTLSADGPLTPTDLILGPRELAALLRISERHLSDVRREDPSFPTPRLVGSVPRWHLSAVMAWVSAPATDAAAAAGPAVTRQPRRTSAANRAGSRGRV